MSRVVTEIVQIPFKADAAIDIDSVVDKLIAKISEQEGFLRVKWGRWDEEPSKVQMMINWMDISYHQAFMAGPAYPGLLSVIEGLLSSAPTIIHVHFDEKTINKVLEGPLLEVITYFAVTEGFEEAVQKAMNAGLQVEGCLGYARGNVVEEIAINETEAKGKAHYAAVSWASEQARAGAFASDEVKESGLGVVKSIGGYEMHHVKFQ
ncbi:hypothetical protein BDV18DRAFT_164870 [Aspergillus unguis]